MAIAVQDGYKIQGGPALPVVLTNAALPIGGEAAEGAPASGNPVVVAGKNMAGNVVVLPLITPADGDALTDLLRTSALMRAYNGATIDTWRNNLEGTALASAARTATTSSGSLTNYNHRGIILFLNLTAGTGLGLQVQVQVMDVISGFFTSVNAAPTAVITPGFHGYFIYPGVSAGGSQASSGIVSRTWRVRVTHGDSNSYTYSVGYSLVL